MKQQSPNYDIIQIPPQFKHQHDTRSEKQIFLSDMIVRYVSEANLMRVGDCANTFNAKEMNEFLSHQGNFFFVCLTGLPSFPKQFDDLHLPGPMHVYTMTGLSTDKINIYTEQQYNRIFKSVSMEKQADNIHEIIQKAISMPNSKGQYKQKRKIIIIYHSFGSFVLCAYLKKYGHQRVFGMIDMVGIPITMYRRFKLLTKFLHHQKAVHSQLGSTQSFDNYLLQNSESIYQAYTKLAKQKYLMQFTNKYPTIIFLKYIHQNYIFKDAFEFARNYPKVLKLIIVGRKDTIFQEALQNQKVVHYLYGQKITNKNKNKIQEYKLGIQYQKQLALAYSRLYPQQLTPANIQQKFVFSMQQGKHSIHMQRKLLSSVREIIKQYLYVIGFADKHKLRDQYQQTQVKGKILQKSRL